MPIDYSKWDNLELSDDSDVEIHPNIERGTFLRLRQKKIRDDRENRRIKREGNEAMIAMNKDLIERISKLRAQVLEADEPKMNAILQQWQTDVAEAHKHKVERDGAISQGKQPEQPSEEDMMAALKARISDDLLKAAAKLDSLEEKQAELAKQLAVHVENLRKNLQTAERELEQVKKEEARHIAPDSIVHDGFDRSFVSTAKPADANKSSISAKKTTVTADEVLNPGSVGKHSDVAVEEEEEIEGMDENGELELDSDARAFAKLSKLTDSNDFIRKNLSIISDRKSDQIMAQAFTMELDGKKKLARQYVKQALILTYILKMGASGVNVFFNRVGPKGPAQDSFERDVASYYERIEERCKVIKSERDADDADDEPEVESIQLQCDDPNAPIRIYVPSEDEEVAQRLELFDQLPEDFKDALRVGTLEAINKVLATVSGSEAERLLGICGEGGFLAIDGEIVVDPSENAEQSAN
ncbi:hsp90 co-chaperone Cdc37 [Kickxella alabastrina]|uniref:Hsp90 co-chaperone Cdc37 n=1 Tax=Kickxella alabastrina TaxID=61397 RepID=A0ACC1IFQ9_9FUNG|nr:hsp90 co-chaperone Cdc37 [Kickxella alabastrina]